MPTLEEYEKLDIYKSLIYQICDFLIRKRQSFNDGLINRPIRFQLRDMEDILEYIRPTREDEEVENFDERKYKLEKLKQELVNLSEDSITEGSPTIITILNPEILEDFSGNFDTNQEIKIKCSTEGLQAYKEKLKELTANMEIDGIDFSLTVAPDGKRCVVHFGNKQMNITKGKNIFPLKLNIAMLLFGKKIKVIEGVNNEEISIRTFDQLLNRSEFPTEIQIRSSDYSPGHALAIESLRRVLDYAKDSVSFGARENVINRRSVIEAISDIEKDSLKILGKSLLKRNDDDSVQINKTL